MWRSLCCLPRKANCPRLFCTGGLITGPPLRRLPAVSIHAASVCPAARRRGSPAQTGALNAAACHRSSLYGSGHINYFFLFTGNKLLQECPCVNVSGECVEEGRETEGNDYHERNHREHQYRRYQEDCGGVCVIVGVCECV